jgi:hypothetical protein
MSRGFIQAVKNGNKVVLEFDTVSQGSVMSSELPTVADLVLPGSGHPFSGEFACRLNVLMAGGESV